jgi:hypothetical protein
MLRHLTRRLRLWGATALALSYAFCVLAPAIVFAFGDGSHAVHCLIEDDHTAAMVHLHQSSHAAAHAHADGDHRSTMPAHQAPEHKGKTSDAQCCGLAFTSALPAMLIEMPVPMLLRAREMADQPRNLPSRAPDRLYKPPIPSLPI